MTKRDYEMLAAILRETSKHFPVCVDYSEGWHAAVSSIANGIANGLAADNSRFDKARFLNAYRGSQT